jgi:hypothetical protein
MNFEIGTRVEHHRFGLGAVIECNTPNRVLVRFERAGIRLLALDFTRLSLVSSQQPDGCRHGILIGPRLACFYCAARTLAGSRRRQSMLLSGEPQGVAGGRSL